MDLFGYINAIQKKQYQKELPSYSQWMLNRFFSSESTYIPVISYINSKCTLTDRMHFDLLFYGLPKTNKYLKYNMKKEAKEKHIHYLMEYFNIDIQRAKTYSQLISQEEQEKIIEFFENRGSSTPVKKGKKKNGN